jgi:hypothetical protein
MFGSIVARPVRDRLQFGQAVKITPQVIPL